MSKTVMALSHVAGPRFVWMEGHVYVIPDELYTEFKDHVPPVIRQINPDKIPAGTKVRKTNDGRPDPEDEANGVRPTVADVAAGMADDEPVDAVDVIGDNGETGKKKIKAVKPVV